ncbi:MAG: hypothetical protein E6Q97_21545 [Desulfurellales bacterium]|nr:MAG: hypothetical protein E6Q97_21545 [Desulfurellales bacterium]
MSETSEKNASIELERCMRFWEMREEIIYALRRNGCEGYYRSAENYVLLDRLADRIESISGKEGEE